MDIYIVCDFIKLACCNNGGPWRLCYKKWTFILCVWSLTLSNLPAVIMVLKWTFILCVTLSNLPAVIMVVLGDYAIRNGHLYCVWLYQTCLLYNGGPWRLCYKKWTFILCVTLSNLPAVIMVVLGDYAIRNGHLYCVWLYQTCLL